MIRYGQPTMALPLTDQEARNLRTILEQWYDHVYRPVPADLEHTGIEIHNALTMMLNARGVEL